MITIKIRQWTPIGGVTHVSTSYQVSSDLAFLNILDNHPSDTSNLTVYYSPVDIPVNATYYVRVTRNFSNNTNSGWGDPVAVTNTDANNGVLSYNPIKVYQPVVTVNKTMLDNPLDTTYTITTSAFSGINEGHGYTIWSVLNDKDEIIEYVKSTTNLTTITFTKGINKISNTKHIRVLAVHGTLTNIESSVGESIINITGVNFSLSTVSDVASIGTNLLVSITRPTGLTNTAVSRVDVVDINGTVLWSTVIDPTMLSVLVPGIIFIADSDYEIIGYGAGVNSNDRYVLPVHTMPDYGLGDIRPNYTYGRTITRDVNIGLYPKNGSLRGMTLPSGLTLSNDATTAAVRVTTNQNGTYSKLTTFGTQTLTTLGLASAYFKLLAGDRELLIATTTAGFIGIYVKTIDYYNNNLTLLGSTVIAGESPAVNGGVIVDDLGDIYLATPGYGSIRKIVIDPVTSAMSVTPIPLPVGETGVQTISKDVGGDILVFCTGATVIYSYNPTTGTYTNKYNFPLVFRGRTLKQEELINGDAIVWKPAHVETVNGTVVTDTILDMLYIDNRNSNITYIQPLTGVNYDINGSVLTNDGKVLLLTNETVGTNILMFE